MGEPFEPEGIPQDYPIDTNLSTYLIRFTGYSLEPLVNWLQKVPGSRIATERHTGDSNIVDNFDGRLCVLLNDRTIDIQPLE